MAMSFPTAQQIHGLFHAHGYAVASTPVGSAHRFSGIFPAHDVFFRLQVDEMATHNANGVPTLLVGCFLRLKGSGPGDHIDRWTLKKMFAPSSTHPRVNLSFRIDAMVAGYLSANLIRKHGDLIYRQLPRLIGDMRNTLQSLPVDDAVRLAGERAPVVLIEILSMADLAIGHSGLRKPAPSKFHAGEISLHLEACEGIAYEILPDLVQTMCAVTAFEPISTGPLVAASSRVPIRSELHFAMPPEAAEDFSAL